MKRRSPSGSAHSKNALLRVLKGIRLFATDVDGVLTDGGMYYSEAGDELKKFNTRDGMGIKLLQKAGVITAIVTQERTKLVARRADKLTIPELHQGVMDKLSMIREMADRYRLSLQQVAYIGDDINDLEALSAVGFSAAPADAMPRVKAAVDYVCEKKGGEGAVREIAEMILEAQGAEFEVRGATSEVRRSRFEVRSSRKR
ncbi:KdsC family phosphatase [Nitrospira moscoviensis]|jgi:YrbI family 3-deoxy-D-manno-octulosonate 8-phosphate phosphatase|uniref:3-deoxy-D-manno-octulosonate 8-phosphate phosphatase KdsC n=1 Tax=Nitrospira moscoviensis TaxID=42253 RepID=A0A0K2GFY2_NITMO|nr:HAD hydrolase family protein [Nitrospira moscoviensis]ALA59870.1 3-deoxy-D-manno-octulosonate 8-phosphate phosphatase KdsC [Nitrospira moscoviensis]